MDISDSHRPEQEELFYSLAPKMFGDAVLATPSYGTAIIR